jgi:hypothetical protein
MSIESYSLSLGVELSGGVVDESVEYTILGQSATNTVVMILDPNEEYKEIPFGGLDYINVLFVRALSPANSPVNLSINGSSDVDSIPVEHASLIMGGDTDSDGHTKITSAFLSNGTANTVQVKVIISGKVDL